MNWYLLLKQAAPHYFTQCPSCKTKLLADLLWEKRMDDPTVWVTDIHGNPMSKQDASINQKMVGSWHSRERMTCPKCGNKYFTHVTQQINPITQTLPDDHVEGVGDQPPGQDYHESLALADE